MSESTGKGAACAPGIGLSAPLASVPRRPRAACPPLLVQVGGLSWQHSAGIPGSRYMYSVSVLPTGQGIAHAVDPDSSLDEVRWAAQRRRSSRPAGAASPAHRPVLFGMYADVHHDKWRQVGAARDAPCACALPSNAAHPPRAPSLRRRQAPVQVVAADIDARADRLAADGLPRRGHGVRQAGRGAVPPDTQANRAQCCAAGGTHAAPPWVPLITRSYLLLCFC